MSTLEERTAQLEAHFGGPAAVARLAGVSPSAIYQWRKDVQAHQLKAAPVTRLQQRGGIRPAWLVFGEGPMLETDQAPDLLQHPQGVAHFVGQLTRLLSALPELERGMAIALLERVMKDPQQGVRAASLLQSMLQSTTESPANKPA